MIIMAATDNTVLSRAQSTGFKTCALGLWSLVFGLAQLTNTAAAATYYVDDTNGNNAYDGNQAKPWKTLGRAYTWFAGDGNKVQEGDTVLFRNGNYGQFKENTDDGAQYHILRTNWITYKADIGHTPILTSVNIKNSGTPYGNSYLVFDGFAINDGVRFHYSNYLKVLNCTIKTVPNSVSGFYAPYFTPNEDYDIYCRNATNITIQNCDLSQAYQAVQLLTPVDYATISGNVIHKIAGDGLSISASHVLIEDNYIYDIDCRRTSLGIIGTFTGTWIDGEPIVQANSGATGIYISSTTGRIYAYCTSQQEFAGTNVYPLLNGTITGQSSGATFSSITTIDPTAHTDAIEITSLAGGGRKEHDITLRNNRLVRLNPAPYIQNTQTLKFDGSADTSFYDVNVTNNLFSGCQINAFPLLLSAIDNLVFNNNTCVNSQIRLLYNDSYEGSCIISEFYNNIVSGLYIDNDSNIHGYYGRIISHGNNIFGNNPDGLGGPTYPFDVNSTELVNYNINSLLVNTAANDFNLVLNYMTVNNADGNYAPATDILGLSRVGAPDIGCYEYINTAPVLGAIGNKTVDENSVLSFTLTATDADAGDTITYSSPNLPAGATLVGPTFSWRPNYYQSGPCEVNFIASDGQAQDYEIITITVNNVNGPPVLASIGNKSVNENSTLSFSISATDPDGDTITYSAQNLPTGATFVGSTFSWMPNYNQVGSYPVIFIASDGLLQNSQTITITVNNVNRSPILASTGNKSVNENIALSFSISATDADGGTITYSAQNLPAGATFVGQTFSWTPNFSQAGSYPVTFIASDGLLQNSQTITITVNNVNQSPVLVPIGNKLVHTNILLAFDVNATDSDGNTITYSATGLPTGATFTGRSFRWTPDTSQIGTYYVTFIASDGLLQDSETITITVFYSTDMSAPTVNSLSPAANSTQVPLDRLVILNIADNGDGVDAYSVTININDNIVYTGGTADYNSSYGCCHRTGTEANYTFIYQPHAAFDYDQNVSVVVNAQDLAGNPMSQYSYSFVTEARSFGENKLVNSSSKNLSKGHPATVRDSEGNIWVAWHAGLVSSSGLKRGIYVGKLPAGADNFDASVREANNLTDRCNAALAIDADDKLYLAWQDNRRKKWDIYMSTSVDGTNWSTETRVTDSDSNAVNPVIAVDHSLPPKAYIAWQDDRADNQEIYIASSSDGFATETISRITSDSSDQIKPAIAVDSTNTVYVVWADLRSGSSDIYGAASNNGPWANVPIVTKPGSQTNPAIATEATGTILHLLWVDDTAGNKDIYYTASSGLPETSLAGRNIVDDNSGADQLTPVIITTGSTGASLRVFACWQDTRNVGKSGDTDLYFVEVNHGKEANIFVGDNTVSSNKSAPAIGVDRYGYPYLVWADDRNQNTDIYYAGSTFVHSNALVSQNVSPASDAIIGTEPANITGVGDISIVVPTGAYPCELNITISKIENPPKLPVSLFNFPYEFGPSGTNFNQPVTITIPYSVSASNNPAFAYWYNKLTDALSQQGITNVETIAISPTLYALRFKTYHFTQFIVGDSASSSIQVTKCTITAGSKDNSDKISISGKIDATADNFNDATVIEVAVDSNDMVNPCVLTFPISNTLKKNKYSYSGTENGVKKSFKYDGNTHNFVFAASNVNLSGLGYPLTFGINIGDYLGTAEVNETIVNGNNNRPIPIILLMGVKYSLRVDTCQVKPGKTSNTDQLLVKGGFAVEDTDVDMADRVSEGLVVILGTQTFTISKNDLKTGKGKFACSKAKVTEGGVTKVSFDFNKGSFIMTISNTNITASAGTVDFGVAFAGYSQIRQITLI